MISRALFVSALTAMVFGALSMACAQAPSTPTPLAPGDFISVNGEILTRDAFCTRLEEISIPSQEGARNAGRMTVEQAINEMLLMQLAKQKNVLPSQDQIDAKLAFIRKQSGGNLEMALMQAGISMDDLKKKLTTEQAFVNLITQGVAITDEAVKREYDERLKMADSPFRKPASVKTGLIVVTGKAKADAIYKQLAAGASFETLATKASEHASKKNGGQLDFITKSTANIPKPVFNTANGLVAGKMSKPIDISGGKWAIVKAYEKNAEVITKFDDIKVILKEQIAIREGSAKNNVSKDLAEYTKNATIAIASDKYSDVVDSLKKEAITNSTAPEGTPPGMPVQ